MRLFAAFLVAMPLASTAWAYDCGEGKYSRDRLRVESLFTARLIALAPDRAVLVDDHLWRRSTLFEKQILIEAIICSAAGPNKGLARMRMRSMMTGREIGVWDMGQLTVY